jgi:hypothetical protein
MKKEIKYLTNKFATNQKKIANIGNGLTKKYRVASVID